MTRLPPPSLISRRDLFAWGAGAMFVTTMPFSAQATLEDLKAAQTELFGDRKIIDGRVTLNLPPLAENGYSVPLTVSVDSPMTEADHVKRIIILSPQNPIAHIVTFHLDRRAGRAEISTRIRLGGTQTVRAIAEMNDGTLWQGTKTTIVTLAACVLGG